MFQITIILFVMRFFIEKGNSNTEQKKKKKKKKKKWRRA